MDLWIRSQNRLKLVEVKEIYVIDIFKTTQHYPETIRSYEYTNVESNNIMLGKYETKERAIEVLDEIQKHLFGINRYDFFVYEMPEE